VSGVPKSTGGRGKGKRGQRRHGDPAQSGTQKSLLFHFDVFLPIPFARAATGRVPHGTLVIDD
jgi:hypothetical protein